MSDEQSLPLGAQGLPAPTPSELAALAIQLCGAAKVEENPVAAMKRAAAVWVDARCRCEIVANAEAYRVAALADETERDACGDLTQAAVMKIEGIPRTEHQFLKRAREFFELDWGAVEGSHEGLPMFRYPRLAGLLAMRRDLAFDAGLAKISRAQKKKGFKVLPPAERRWHSVIAEEFAAWLARDKSEKGRIGGKALQGQR